MLHKTAKITQAAQSCLSLPLCIAFSYDDAQTTTQNSHNWGHLYSFSEQKSCMFFCAYYAVQDNQVARTKPVTVGQLLLLPFSGKQSCMLFLNWVVCTKPMTVIQYWLPTLQSRSCAHLAVMCCSDHQRLTATCCNSCSKFKAGPCVFHQRMEESKLEIL